jgi:hypothetical protein
MPQFDIYVRNALQWGIGKVWSVSPDEALKEAQRLIDADPASFEMFSDGEFCDGITQIRIYESGDNETLAKWQSPHHGLRVFASELLAVAENVVERWEDGNLAEAVRRLAAVIAKTTQQDL